VGCFPLEYGFLSDWWSTEWWFAPLHFEEFCGRIVSQTTNPYIVTFSINEFLPYFKVVKVQIQVLEHIPTLGRDSTQTRNTYILE
jgi:hypothetical protein